ncbi:MAG: hypothetical protein A4E58_02428 [Syntrophorhabdus sp. PtaB.Bin006]|nr:MAG: hypothetical protein A4E58_02428 [Syntrophorhabdus sp. PtaB.Bin006]
MDSAVRLLHFNNPWREVPRGFPKRSDSIAVTPLDPVYKTGLRDTSR